MVECSEDGSQSVFRLPLAEPFSPLERISIIPGGMLLQGGAAVGANVLDRARV